LPSPNWSRPLPRLLVIPDVMQLRTLADVRELIEQHLPAYCRDKASWRVVARDLKAGTRRRSGRSLNCSADGAIARGRRVPAALTPASRRAFKESTLALR
jgi:hypothetical protein